MTATAPSGTRRRSRAPDHPRRYNWADRFPWIVEVARKFRQQHFVLDGEAVVLGLTGDADFDALHSRKHDHEVQLYTFDMLAGDGDDYRKLPLSLRKLQLARLLRSRSEGIFIAPFESARTWRRLAGLRVTSNLRSRD